MDGAVIVDGVDRFREPTGSILFLDPSAAQAVDEEYASNTLKKETWGEREDVLNSAASPGVLNTLARATRAALQANPHITREFHSEPASTASSRSCFRRKKGKFLPRITVLVPEAIIQLIISTTNRGKPGMGAGLGVKWSN